MVKDLTYLASRAFNTPILMEPKKMEIILGVLVQKLETGEISLKEGESKRDKRYTVNSDGVAVIPVFGSLVNRGLTMGPWSGMTSYEYIRNSLEDAVTDPDISAIILDIDSPGGEADGAFDLSDAIYAMRGIKPIIASVNGMAASAAYAIASATDKIISTRTGVTGSIGVIAAHRDISEKNAKEGIKYTIVRAGEKKALLNSLEPMSESAMTKLQGEIDVLYDMFVDTVARNRNLSAKVIRDTQADSFMGDKALELGLIDEINTPQATLKGLLQPKFAVGVKEVASATNVNSSTEKEKAMSDKDETKAEAKVVDLDSARKEGHAQATEIVQLCALAGKPQMAGVYLTEGKSAAEVRTLLLAEQVAEDKIEVNNSSGTGMGANYADPNSNPLLKLAHAHAKKVAMAGNATIN